MNCVEYREAIAADPSESFDGGAAHAAGCEECRKYRQEMQALDERIARALAIEVPELRMPELPPIETGSGKRAGRRASGFPASRFATPPFWAGLAAAAVVAAVLVAGIPQRERGPEDLVGEILAHMDHEESSRQVTSVPVATQTLDRVVRPQVADMDPDIGLVTYAMSCIINGRTVPHLVIQGNKGPVTLILLPEETIDAPVRLSGENVHGVLLPVGNGSIAVIGQREDQLDEIGDIGRKLAESVEWNI
jgi:anti-sigma factor RsiW